TTTTPLPAPLVRLPAPLTEPLRVTVLDPVASNVPPAPDTATGLLSTSLPVEFTVELLRPRVVDGPVMAAAVLTTVPMSVAVPLLTVVVPLPPPTPNPRLLIVPPLMVRLALVLALMPAD